MADAKWAEHVLPSTICSTASWVLEQSLRSPSRAWFAFWIAIGVRLLEICFAWKSIAAAALAICRYFDKLLLR